MLVESEGTLTQMPKKRSFRKVPDKRLREAIDALTHVRAESVHNNLRNRVLDLELEGKNFSLLLENISSFILLN